MDLDKARPMAGGKKLRAETFPESVRSVQAPGVKEEEGGGGGSAGLRAGGAGGSESSASPFDGVHVGAHSNTH